MARDRANIRTSMWGDADYRALSLEAQWLYEYLLTTHSLSYVGVADWRPARIAKMCGNKRASDIVKYGKELENGHFIFTDEETEEVLIRSFLKWDGCLRNPNLWKSIGLAFTDVASMFLQAQIGVELRKLKVENPDGFGKANPWVSDHLSPLLDTPSDTQATPPSTGGLTPERHPLAQGVGQRVPTTSTATATATNTLNTSPSASVSDFEIAYAHWPKKTERKKSLELFIKKAKKMGVEKLISEVVRFGDAYAASTEKQFVPALDVWLRNERWTDELPGAVKQQAKFSPRDAWMAR